VTDLELCTPDFSSNSDFPLDITWNNTTMSVNDTVIPAHVQPRARSSVIAIDVLCSTNFFIAQRAYILPTHLRSALHKPVNILGARQDLWYPNDFDDFYCKSRIHMSICDGHIVQIISTGRKVESYSTDESV